MRSITVEVPPGGVKLHFTSSARTANAKVILVVPDGVEVHLPPSKAQTASPPPEPKATPRSTPTPAAPSRPSKALQPKKAPVHGGASAQSAEPEPEYIAKRLRKLKVKSIEGAINSIKAMFQFREQLTDQGARLKLNAARKAGLVFIASNGHVTYPDA